MSKTMPKNVKEALTMVEANLDLVPDDDLKRLNHEIVKQSKKRRNQRDAEAASQFRVGELVDFEDRDGGQHKCRVLTVNQRSLSLEELSPGKGSWRVGFSFCKKVDEEVG